MGADGKHQDGQTAMKSPMLPASAQIGRRTVHHPERVLVPPKSGGTGLGGGGEAEASPNVKWHLLSRRRGGSFFSAGVPGDPPAPKSGAAVSVLMLLQIPGNPSHKSQVHLASEQNEVPRLTATINTPPGDGGASGRRLCKSRFCCFSSL